MRTVHFGPGYSYAKPNDEQPAPKDISSDADGQWTMKAMRELDHGEYGVFTATRDPCVMNVGSSLLYGFMVE
ncbi:MAG: hypothetical protein ACRD16_04100 [Thermoanaerobaculia bacterium]